MRKHGSSNSSSFTFWSIQFASCSRSNWICIWTGNSKSSYYIIPNLSTALYRTDTKASLFIEDSCIRVIFCINLSWAAGKKEAVQRENWDRDTIFENVHHCIWFGSWRSFKFLSFFAAPQWFSRQKKILRPLKLSDWIHITRFTNL